MNLQELKDQIDEVEAESPVPASEIKVGVYVHDKNTNHTDMMGVTKVDLSKYVDPGEVNFVTWLVAGPY